MSRLLWVNERKLNEHGTSIKGMTPLNDFNAVARGYYSFVPRFSKEPNIWGLDNENYILDTITETVNFTNITDSRMQDILEVSYKENLPILIHWSGGIDSTVILSAFLKHCDKPEQKVEILMGDSSIIENTVFYEKFIKNKFNIVKGEDYNLETMLDKYIHVTGQPADQLFHNQRTVDVLSNHSILSQNIINNAKSFGITLNTAYDLSWWAHFNYTWNDIRFLDIAEYGYNLSTNTLINHQTNHIKWFDTIDYQRWGFNRNREYDINPTLTKMEFKDYIYNFDYNSSYRDNMVKKSSSKKQPIKSNILGITSDYCAITGLEEFYSSLPSA